MIDDEHSGIANLLNLPRKTPVRTQKVYPQEDPIVSLSETLMNIKSLSLPKSEPEPKDEYGYTKKQNQEIEKQLTRDTSKSKGAWNAFVKANTDPNKPKNVHATKYMEQMKDKHGSYDNYSKLENSKILQNNINNKKIGVLDYIEKVKTNHNDPGSERYVNKSLNKFENRTDNKSVVTFDPTTQLFTDETRNIAFKDYHQAKRWNDAVNKQPTATPQQVNDLKGRLDNSRAFGHDPENQKDNRKQKEQTNKNRRLI